ncbi:hypothetical protein PENSPDRAFT_679020 [Peniophora sp. CONT]|nr:hypothetical protein PENSPDRAFT_679020 [Peniophora sp. CONT]
MVKAPPKLKELSRREQRALNRPSPTDTIDFAFPVISLLSPEIGWPDTPSAADKERGRPTRRRLLPRSYKTGGRKRPIAVLSVSSQSRSPSLCQPETGLPKSSLDLECEERDRLVASYQDRARLVSASVLQLSSQLDGIVLQHKWDRECKALEERLRNLDAARDLVGAIQQFTAHFTKENMFKPTHSSVEITSGHPPVDAASSGGLSASSVCELISMLVSDLDTAPETSSTGDCPRVPALPTSTEKFVAEELNDTTVPHPTETAQTTDTAQATKPQATIIVEPHLSPPSAILEATPPRTYYEELMMAALPTTKADTVVSDSQQRSLPALKPSLAKVFKDRVLFSRSDRRDDSPVHLLEGKGCILRPNTTSGSSPRLSSPTTPRMDAGDANPYSELVSPGELVSNGRIATKRRRAIRPPLHVHAGSHAYAYSQDQSNTTPTASPGDLEDHSDADAGSIGVSGDVPSGYDERPIQLSDIHIYTASASLSSKKTAAVNCRYIADEVRFPPQAHSRSPSARQRFATWSTTGFARASAGEAAADDSDALESGYANDLAQFRQRQHSTGLSLLEKVWRW